MVRGKVLVQRETNKLKDLWLGMKVEQKEVKPKVNWEDKENVCLK